MKFTDMKRGYAAMNAGQWVSDIPLPLFKGIRLKVRRLWNPDYTALHEKLAEGKPDPLPADDERAITDQCLVDACLLDWDGVDDAFSPEAAKALLADSEPDGSNPFRFAVIWAASNLSDTVKAQLEADEKN